MSFRQHLLGQSAVVPDSDLTIKFELLLEIIKAVYVLLWVEYFLICQFTSFGWLAAWPKFIRPRTSKSWHYHLIKMLYVLDLHLPHCSLSTESFIELTAILFQCYLFFGSDLLSQLPFLILNSEAFIRGLLWRSVTWQGFSSHCSDLPHVLPFLYASCWVVYPFPL